MKGKLNTVRTVNLILWILFCLHILVEWMFYHVVGIFHEMYYLPFLAAGMIVLCWMEFRQHRGTVRSICDIFGAVLFAVLLVLAVVSMLLDFCGSRGEDFFCVYCGRNVVAAFLPVLASGMLIQQVIRTWTCRGAADKLGGILTVALLAVYLYDAVTLVMDYYAEQGEVALFPFTNRAAVYIPLIILVNGVFWFVKQVRETIALPKQV
ncbi:MAG: hypothetical protein IKC09_01150 [Oscillospiraceae bacterium]|nr:hypothetical protein [Oscillospiraceae bacterium]